MVLPLNSARGQWVLHNFPLVKQLYPRTQVVKTLVHTSIESCVVEDTVFGSEPERRVRDRPYN